MTTNTELEYRGRKQKVGAPIFSPSGRLNFFMGYCENCHGKCMVTSEEAHRLMRMFGKQQHKPLQRVAVRLLRKYSLDY